MDGSQDLVDVSLQRQHILLHILPYLLDHLQRLRLPNGGRSFSLLYIIHQVMQARGQYLHLCRDLFDLAPTRLL